MKVVCIIPARLGSRRFPQKVLSMLGHKPMLEWVWEAAWKCALFDTVAFAIDDPQTARLIESFQGTFFMTSSECLSGTDRLIELMENKKVTGDVWVNWQGDEPLIHREMISALLKTVEEEKFDIWTLKTKIKRIEEIDHPGTVKVVTNAEGQALYFSRSPIPYYQESGEQESGEQESGEQEQKTYFKHMGIYAFREKALKRISPLTPSTLEKTESLEQLRFLENGLKIQVHQTPYDTIGIDHEEDLALALEWMALRPSPQEVKRGSPHGKLQSTS